MSKFGAMITINGAQFAPLIDTKLSAMEEPTDNITAIFLLDDGNDRNEAMEIKKMLDAQYIGKPYSEWLDRFPGRASSSGSVTIH